MGVRDLSPKISILVCLFAAGSWLAVNGIWLELPILVAQSPQSWSLPSYLSIAIQVANIGPVLYMLANKYVKVGNRSVVTEVPVIYAILSIGAIASSLMAFLWQETSQIGGNSYSTALIALTFFQAMTDCTSSVTFIPFMSAIPVQYMTVFFIGQGFSGFLPSIASLIQGMGQETFVCKNKFVLKNVSKNVYNSSSNQTITSYVERNVTELRPRYLTTTTNFTARDFFLFLTIMTIFSLTSFGILTRIARKNMETQSVEELATSDANNANKEEQTSTTKLSNSNLFILLATNAVINGVGNGVLPALQSYACLPYGSNIYHLTLTLSAVANPVACFAYFFVTVRSLRVVLLWALVYLATAAYTVAMAAGSPCPLLKDSSAGGVLVLLATVLGMGLFSYLKTAITLMIRERSGHRALQWCGACMQLGSLVGALVIFPLVNVYAVFKTAPPCHQCV